jgi:hypothetical protein
MTQLGVIDDVGIVFGGHVNFAALQPRKKFGISVSLIARFREMYSDNRRQAKIKKEYA